MDYRTSHHEVDEVRQIKGDGPHAFIVSSRCPVACANAPRIVRSRGTIVYISLPCEVFDNIVNEVALRSLTINGVYE